MKRIPLLFRAFTLIESMIVLAVSVVVIIIISALVYNFNTMSVYQKASSSSSGSAMGLLREIESLTLSADAVLSSHSFSTGVRSSSSTVLVLEIPSIDSSGNVIAGMSDYAAFYASGTNAYRLLEANAQSRRSTGTKQLSSSLRSLTFSYDNSSFATTSMVTIDIQTQASAKQNTVSDHLHEQLRLRNY